MQTMTIAREIKESPRNAGNLQSSVGIRYLNHQAAYEGRLYLEDNSLLFVCEGELLFQYGEAVFVAQRHQTVFLRKHVQVRYQAVAADNGKAEGRFLLFTLKNTTVLEFIKSTHLQTICQQSPEMILVHHPGQRLLSCMASVESYFMDGASITEHLARIKLLELLFCLPGSVQDQGMLEQILDLREPFRGDITHVIEENIMNTLSLSQLARLSGRSLSSFRRDFLAIYNMPPSRWIRLKRLDKARELLAGTKLTVTDICYTLGFENIAHFSRVFKGRFGFPPTALRNMPGASSR